MIKDMDIWNFRGLTKKDDKEMKKRIKKDIPLLIDDDGKVYNEGGMYIADAIYDSENGVGIAVQNESWGGARKGTGPKKTLPAGARRRALAMTDSEYEAVKNLVNKMRN